MFNVSAHGFIVESTLGPTLGLNKVVFLHSCVWGGTTIKVNMCTAYSMQYKLTGFVCAFQD